MINKTKNNPPPSLSPGDVFSFHHVVIIFGVAIILVLVWFGLVWFGLARRNLVYHFVMASAPYIHAYFDKEYIVEVSRDGIMIVRGTVTTMFPVAAIMVTSEALRRKIDVWSNGDFLAALAKLETWSRGQGNSVMFVIANDIRADDRILANYRKWYAANGYIDATGSGAFTMYKSFSAKNKQ